MEKKRFLIEDAKCGITGGPLDGIVVTSVKFNDGEKSKWLNLAEVEGIPCFYMTDEDVYDKLIENDFDDEAHLGLVANHRAPNGFRLHFREPPRHRNPLRQKSIFHNFHKQISKTHIIIFDFFRHHNSTRLQKSFIIGCTHIKNISRNTVDSQILI